jgi:YD repeat-containing protein
MAQTNGVWDSNYTAVYHLANTGTGTAADSTSYGNGGTLTSVSAASGKIDGAASFNGVSNYIQIPQADFPTYPTADSLNGTIPSGQPPFTASFGLWFKTASPGGLLAQMPDPDYSYLGVCIPIGNPEPGDWDPPSNPMLYVDDNGNLEADNGSIVTHAAYNDNNWHYAVITNASDGTGTVYVDGQNVASQPAFISAYSPNYVYFVGTAYTWLSDLGNSDWLYFNGSIDEIRVSSIARSSDWIKTEYNNQGSPTTFYTFNPASSVQVVPSGATLYGSQGQQFATTALCNTVVAWSMTAGAQGTLTSGGFYTAPAGITTPQTVTITATNQATGATIGSSVVTLLPPPLPITLSAAAQPPYTTGSSQALSATLKDQYGNAETGVTVTFIVSGVNNNIGSSTTDNNGIASYSYFGANNGNDNIQATAVVSGQLLTSNSVSIFWTVPAESNLAANIALAEEPALGLGGLIGAFTDNNGAVIEPIAIGASPRSYVVPAGATQLQMGINDSYLADNGGAGFTVAVNGNPVPVPATTRPWNWVTGGLNNNYQYGIGTAFNPSGDGTSPAVVKGLTQGQSVSVLYQRGTVSTNFPTKSPVNADGDQMNITGGTLFQGAYYPTLYTNTSSYPVDQPITFNALVTNSSGTPLSNIPVTLYVTGANPGQYQATTDSTGTAAFMYSGLYEGTDSLLAQAFPSGQSGIVSGQASITWTNFPTPPPVGSLTFTDDRIYGPDNEQGFIVAATDASGSPVFDANVGFYVWGANNYSASGMTDVNGEVPFTFEHNPGAWNAVAVDSVGRNVVITNPLSGVWTSSTTSNPPGYEITVGISALNTVTMPNILRLNGTATDNLGNTLTATWSQVSGPGTITFTPAQQQVTNGSVVANASFSDAGSYVLQLTASDGLGSSASTQTTVTVTPPLRNPQGWIGSPVYGSTVKGIVPITLESGVTLQPGGVLTYYPATNSSNNTTLSITAESGTISTLDTTVLPNGSYWIQLQATDTNGDQQYSLVLVTVVGNYKPGRVTATVTDLVVPATGLAINIQRTYDSLNAGTSGDFGYGWNLGVNVNLVVDDVGNVTFTLGGQRKTFNLTPAMPPCSGLVCLFPYYFVAYTPEPGLHGTLNDGGQACPFDIVVPDGSLWSCYGGGQYTPTSYIYTDPNGTSYTISAAGNLQSMQDRSGNGLTITPTGITSSTGLSVPFVRDSSNRITQITDPQGNIYQYAYDGSGNLASVTYPPTTQTSALCPNTTLPNTSTYTYDSNHLYTGGTDALCHVLPSTAYFPSGKLDANGNSMAGRLQSVTDAMGNTTSYEYLIATAPSTSSTTTVHYPLDANGNSSSAVMTYDGYGMLLSTKDPLGLITTNVYDVNHNLISVTDPLGHTNSYTYDSNGNKTSSTYPVVTQGVNTTSYTAYNQYSEPTSTTDELGNVRTFNYDASYNPQSVTDTINGAPATLASFIFNANGTLQAGAIGYDITAQPSMASQFSYDANGNMTGRIDALGRFTSYTYDALGNKLTTTLPLPNSNSSATSATTTYSYDAFGHLTQTAAPLGRTTGSTYDANGNKTSDTDARGNVTSYQYDALNRLTITTYPTIPVTTSTKSYDFRNNVIDETDQAGHITHHIYDLSGRQTSITKGFGTPQASATSFTYYDDGRKYTETDALNHTTTYLYDAAGRLTSIAGPKGNFTYAYDAAGNRISSADGNGNATTFQYDARKRLVKTVYPDKTSTTNSYDGPGNLASVTDPAGAVVQYMYDPANQLKTVVQVNHPNPSNNTNTYGYDPLGNLTALTDENLHATQNVFDLLNEPVSKTLPDQTLTETRQYDAAGNLVSLTHFNGVTTTYTYDAQNRKLTQSTPGEPTISFTYTPTGKYLTSTAGDGTVNYTYDPLDRLTTKATPEGTLSYTYYANGNVESIVSSNPNGVSVTLTWDVLNRLSTVIEPVPQIWTEV